MNHPKVLILAAGAMLAFAGPAAHGAAAKSDAEVRKQMIRESISSYPGNCPCPYNSARNGSSCGARSAWSRAGGYAPLCYASDISKTDVQAYRRAHGL